MRRYKVTLLVPQSSIIEAIDVQDAHNKVTKMINSQVGLDDAPLLKVHSIIEFAEPEEIILATE